MTQNRCTTCPRPIPDTAFGCGYCAGDLAQRLDQLAAFLPELETTVAKLDRIGSGGPKAVGAEVPLPYRPDVGDKRRAIRNELTTWARDVEAETGRTMPMSSSAALAKYLAVAVEGMRYRQQWPEFYASLRPLYGSVLHLIDRPAEKVYLGPCNTQEEATGAWCQVDVLAPRGASVGVCKSCGTEHDVAEAKRWLLGLLADHKARPDEIRGIMGRMGMAIAYSTLAAYVSPTGREPLEAKGEDGHGRPLYRLGDVVDRFVERQKFGRRTVDREAMAS